MTIHRYEVTDAEWAIIEPMLPKHHMGRPQKDLRAHFNGLTVFCGLPAAELVGKTFQQGMGRIRPYTAAFAAGVMTVRWNASFTHLVQMQNLKS